DEAAIERSDVHAAAIERDAAIDNVTAYKFRMILGDLRVVLPQQAARLRIEGVYQAPRARRVEDAILNQWRRFESAQSHQIVRPCEAELAYRLLIDSFA